MNIIDRVVAFFKNLFGGGPTIEPVKITSKEAKEIDSLKTEIDDLKNEKNKIQEQLQQMDTDFMYGKITPEARDKNYVQFMSQAMKLNREITSKRQRIFALGGIVPEI
jgi:predicted RNase H-like nuclease (RuvC/YqgF family)